MANDQLRITTTFPLSEKHRAAILAIEPAADLRVCESIGEAEAEDALADTEILLTYGEDLTPEWIDKCGSLKWIQVISAGLDRMPFPAIDRRGILVTNAKGIHAVPISEYVMGMLLSIVRRFPQFFTLQQNSDWDRSIRIDEAEGKTVGILGAGAIGSAIAEKAKTFGMKTIGMNTSGRPAAHFDEMVPREQMDKVLAKSDFVVVIVPLTPETNRMIGERELRLMKQSAWLINIARGDVVEEDALVRALAEDWIGGAVLDVFSQEPLPSGHPLWQAKNCLLTPHVSGRSPKYMERAMAIFLQNLPVYCEGKRTGFSRANFVNPVDPARGY